MSKSEENAKTEILNPSAEAVVGVAQDEKRKAKNDKPDGLLTYQHERLALANERLEDENERLRDVHELRKEYIPKLFGLTCVWLVVVAVFLWKVAGGRDFYLYDNVL